MKYLNVSIILCFFLISPKLWANKYYDGYLITSSGEKKSGMIEMFYGYDSKINFKENADGNKIKFNSVDLSEIGLYQPESSDTIVYRRYRAAAYTWGKTPKISKDEIWAYEVYNSEQVQGFYSPLPQVVHNAGSIRSWQMFSGFVKLKGQDFILHIVDLDEGMSDPFSAYDKQMRKFFSNAIKDICPIMVENIKKRKYKKEEFLTMLADYSETCK